MPEISHFAVSGTAPSRLFRRLLVLFALLFGGAVHADCRDFYVSALARGRAEFTNGRFSESVPLLRIAAFGCMNDMPAYQLANVYMSLSLSRLGDHAGALTALRRVKQAEELEANFTGLDLGAERTAVEELAKRAGIELPRGDGAPPPTTAAEGAPAVAPPDAVRTSVPAPQSAVETGTCPVDPQPDTSANPSPDDPPQYALQVAIACEASTIQKVRDRVAPVTTSPIAIGSRSCHRILVGRFNTAGEAMGMREETRRLSGTPDLPVVVVLPRP